MPNQAMQQTAGHDRFPGCIARRGPRRQVSWVVLRLKAFLKEGDNITRTRWAFVLAVLTAGGWVLTALSAPTQRAGLLSWVVTAVAPFPAPTRTQPAPHACPS